MKVKFKKKHVKPVRRITPRSTSIFAPIQSNKPVKRYWGDYDGDGVINGLDCAPRNKFKQGPQHKTKLKRYPYKKKTPEELNILNQFSESTNRLIKEGKTTISEATEARDSFVGGIREEEEWMEREAHKRGCKCEWED